MLFDMQRPGSQALWPSSVIFLGDLNASGRGRAGCELWYSHTIRKFFHAVSCHYLPPEEGLVSGLWDEPTSSPTLHQPSSSTEPLEKALGPLIKSLQTS